MEAQFLTLLLNASQLPFTNVGWGNNPEHTTFPSITISLISERGAYVAAGKSPVSEALIQVDIFSTDIDELFALKNKVIAIDTSSSAPINSILIERAYQGPTEEFDSNVVSRYCIDFRVFYNK